MSGSGASILGYGDITPNANVNPDMVNVDGSTYAGNFSSNQIPTSARSLPEPPSNVVAASGTWTGGRSRKRKGKNLSKVYKMKAKSGKRHTRHAKSMKKHTKTGKKHVRVRVGGKKRTMRKRVRKAKKSRKMRRTRRAHKMRGGYSQFSSNVPNTPGYGLAGSPVAPAMSAMANPPIYNRYIDCPDNYNHYAATQK